MADLDAVLDLLRCPACLGTLSLEGSDALACGGDACGARYPIAGGLPWLYRDVPGSRAQWAAKLQHFRATTLGELESLDASLARDDLLDTTRERLRRQRAGVERQAEQVFALLEPFAFSQAEAGGGGTAEAATMLKDRIPSAQHVTSYLETAHRDWAWGESEVRETMALARPLVGALEAGASVLVLGGGAGRFAWELAVAHPDARVVQLDLNPVLGRIAAEIAADGSVTLTELPRFPLSVEDAVVDQTLARPESGERPAVAYCIGDVFAPPFAPSTFDRVVAPWIVDILPEAFPGLARRLGALVADGGRLVGFGPLSFESQSPAGRFTPEEMVDVLEAAGFDVEQAGTEQVAHLHSPHGMSRRGEEIFAFAAKKRGAIEAPPPFHLHPEWLRDGRLPIPEDPRFETMRAEKTFDVEILKSIDGRASIEDLVVILSSRYGLAPDRCRNTILRFFVRWLESPRG